VSPASENLRWSEFDRWTRRRRRSDDVPGLSVGLFRRGRRPITRGYGWRDRARRLPASPQTVFGTGSVTKSFTALAVLRLQELGALRVRDPVVRYLPEFRTPDPRRTARISLHHLLTHTSGLPPLPSLFYMWARSEARAPTYESRAAQRLGIDPTHPPIDRYEDLIEFLGSARYRLVGAPEQYFSYSNEGYSLLGAVIERASGRTFEGWLDDAILRPAGLRSATFDPGVLVRSDEVTTLYSANWHRGGAPLLASQEWTVEGCSRPAGGLTINVEDLLRFVELVVRGGRVGGRRILSTTSVTEMIRPHAELFPGLYYGYGALVRRDERGRVLAFHGGARPGVSAVWAAAPSAGVGGAVLANRIEAPTEAIVAAAINPMLGRARDVPLVGLPEPGVVPPSLDEYGGWYGSGELSWYEIRARRRHLRVDDRGLPPRFSDLRLRPIGGDDFAAGTGAAATWVRFLRDRQGRVIAMNRRLRFVRKRDPRDRAAARRGRIVW